MIAAAFPSQSDQTNMDNYCRCSGIVAHKIKGSFCYKCKKMFDPAFAPRVELCCCEPVTPEDINLQVFIIVHIHDMLV